MPALDSSNVPGTLSAKVLTGLLRGEMGFKGIIISDAMDMRGVLDQFGAAEATKRGIAAGIDILIQPSDVAQTIDAVVAGVSEGRYTAARLDSSVRRVLETKRRLGLAQKKLVDLSALRFLVGDSSNLQVARKVAEKSITLVKDSLRQVPLSVPGARVLSITLARRTDLSAGNAFNAELRSGLPNLHGSRLRRNDSQRATALHRFRADSLSAGTKADRCLIWKSVFAATVAVGRHVSRCLGRFSCFSDRSSAGTAGNIGNLGSLTDQHTAIC